MNTHMKPRLCATAASFFRYPSFIALLLAGLPLAQATTYYWATNTTGLWQTGTNWSTDPSGTPAGTVAPASSNTTDDVVFNGSGLSGATIVQLSAAASITGITINNTGTTNIQSNSTTAKILTIGAGGITMAATAGSVTLDTTNKVNVTIGANQTWTNSNSASTLSGFNGITMGGNTLTLAGAGNFSLSPNIIATAAGVLNADQSGTFTLANTGGYSNFVGTLNTGANGGTLSISGNQANFANAALAVIKGGTIATATSVDRQFNTANISVTANFIVGQAVTGTGAVAFTGAMDLNGATRQLTINNPTANKATIISGIISNGGIAKAGPGTLTYNGTASNTYTGLTTVGAGTLTLAKTATVNAIAGNVLVNGTGTLKLGASDQINDTANVEVATGGTFAMSSSNETIAGLTLTGGAITGGNATVSVTLTVGTTTLDLQSGTTSANVILAGAVAANKTTSGTVTLSGNNTYTGNTTVTAGTLGLKGSSTSPVSLADGTVLQLDLVSPVTSTSTLSFAGNATVSVTGTPVAATTYNLFTGSAITGTPALSAPIAGFALSNTGTVLQLVPSGGGDTTKPIITLTGNDTLTVNMGSTYTDAGATATDETAPPNPVVTTSDSVNTAVPGIYVLSYNAVDTAGNNALTVTRTVTVVDATAPFITLTGAATVSVDWGSPYSDAGATATDNYDTSVTVSTIGTVNTAKPGTYTLTYNASDVALNAATPVTRTVTVAIANSTTVDANGYTPLMRYALGANSPGDTVAAPVTSATATELSLTAVVRTDDPKLSVLGTTKTDLTSGTWTTTGVSGSPAGSGTEGDQTGVTTGQRRAYTVTTTTKTFLRLEATLAP
jgi:autotransporter-associated beta strand protein